MSRKWLIGVGVGLLATAAVVTVGVGAYELGQRDSDRVLVTGTETSDGRIIVDHDGWDRGGPGFLIIPLLIVGTILLLSSRRCRGWGGGGYGQRHRDDRDPERRSDRGRLSWEDEHDREQASSGAPPGTERT